MLPLSARCHKRPSLRRPAIEIAGDKPHGLRFTHDLSVTMWCRLSGEYVWPALACGVLLRYESGFRRKKLRSTLMLFLVAGVPNLFGQESAGWPIPAMDNPAEIFGRMFGATTVAERNALASRGSVIAGRWTSICPPFGRW